MYNYRQFALIFVESHTYLYYHKTKAYASFALFEPRVLNRQKPLLGQEGFQVIFSLLPARVFESDLLSAGRTA